MKYGILAYKKSVRPESKNWSNLGDPIQSYAMVKIYEEMGVTEEELLKIDRYSTSSYNGEYVILPYNCYNMVFNQYKHEFNSLPVSDNIIPVYVSFHLHSRSLDKTLLQQLKNFEPIGCRDEETMQMLRKNNVRAYLSGCVTATLPKRKESPLKGKVYFVDYPKSLDKYIPKHILDKAEYSTHLPYIPRVSDDVYLTDEEERNYYQLGVKQLEDYETNACLVITSRLHVAAPCMAMGIPVILVSENFDGRFSWIDKYLPLYTPKDFDKINWNPAPVEYEKEKKLLKEHFIYRLKKAYEDNALLYDCSSIYEDRVKSMYNKDLIDSLSKINNNNKMKHLKYALWGLRADTLNLHHVIEDYMPDWELAAVIDQNSSGFYEGYKILTSDDIPDLDKDITFIVIPEIAHEFASDFLKRHNLKCILVQNQTHLIEI
ncbi:polysaccharide pyruvyl transferase family protein [Paenibacillus camerounensis]|uniref:polysaccharide pyruvyl transferase family protein n=1 Tax=Paenibacillus camerounensis TaxID=1243663 RepID=UPI0005AA4D3D|nr:polysaccharide pyruvyl transferase family protein [Paenibacillus camerounensis]